jgi:hypothetical protein
MRLDGDFKAYKKWGTQFWVKEINKGAKVFFKHPKYSNQSLKTFRWLKCEFPVPTSGFM